MVARLCLRWRGGEQQLRQQQHRRSVLLQPPAKCLLLPPLSLACLAPPLSCLLFLPSRTLHSPFLISLSLPPPPLPSLHPHGAPLAALPALPSLPARRAQARGTAAGEQQARGAPGRAAGARAAGQQRRPHQRLRLQYRPCHHTPLEPTPPQVQVQVQAQVRPCSPCPLSIEAPPPPAPHNQLSTRGGEGCGVNTDAPSRPSSVAVQVAVVGGEGGSTPLGWDGMGEYRDGSSGTSWYEVSWVCHSSSSFMHASCLRLLHSSLHLSRLLSSLLSPLLCAPFTSPFSFPLPSSSLCPDLPLLVPAGRSHGSGSGAGHGVHRQQLLSTQPTHS
ncbi:unnamed protein product [Closterium sp. NIES-54]